MSVEIGKDVGDDAAKRTSFKELIGTLQSLITVVAILSGGYWFVAQRSLKPQVKLEQTVTQRALDGEAGWLLVAVDVRATNVGKTKVSLTKGSLELIQVNPLPGKSMAVVALPAMDLEPGESDQAILRTWKTPGYIKTIEVHSSYAVPSSKEFWNVRSLVDVGGEKIAASKAQTGS